MQSVSTPRSLVSIALLTVSFALLAQQVEPPTNPPKETPPVGLTETPAIVSRAAHSREWQWVERLVDENGTTNEFTHGFTEIGSGACWWDGKAWQDTVPAFTPAKGNPGFVVERAATQVAVAADISVAGSVTIVTPEGRTLRSTPSFLVFTDRATGKSLRVAEVKSAQGELVEPNVVLWRDAVVDNAGRPLGDYRIVFTAAAVEADVVWRKQLPDPAAFGMPPETTDVSVYTEFFGTEPTAIVAQEVAAGAEKTQPDAQLWFGGSSVMDKGKAFAVDEAGVRTGVEVAVRKEWGRFEGGRTFLLEQAAFTDLQPLLKCLPEAAAPSPEQRRALEKLRQTAKLELPPRHGFAPTWARDDRDRLVVSVGNEASRPLVIAAAQRTRGVVWDYTLLATTPSITLASLTNYYCAGAVNVSTSLTANAGTVVKYANTNSPSLNVLSGATLTWLGAPYRPLSLVSRDDNSVGEVLPGSTGSPSGYYATTALSLAGLPATTLTNVCIRNASVAIDFTGSNPLTVRHAQFVNCGTGVKAGFTTALQNALFHQVENVVWTTGVYGSTGEHVTADSVLYLNYNPGGGLLGLTNSLVAASVSNTNGVTLTASLVAQGYYGPMFTNAGAGAHYVNLTNLNWNFAPSLNSSTEPLASELAKMTVVAPTLVASPIAANQLLAAFDLNAGNPFLYPGYRYWPIHFLGSGLAVTNATLTLTNAVPDGVPQGAVLAFWGTNTIGVTLQSGGKFISQGRPDALNRLCYASAVQEQATAGPSGSVRALIKLTNSPTTRPDLALRFTRAEFQADTSARRTLIDDGGYFLGSFTLRDDQLYGAKLALAPVGTPGAAQTFGVTNNVFDNCDLSFLHYNDEPLTVLLFNNLHVGGRLDLNYIANFVNPAWTVKNNLFVGTTMSGGSTYVSGGYNGYTAAGSFWGGGGDKLSLVTTGTNGFQSGMFGPWYYPTNGNSASLTNLLDAGSQSASLAGLYHYTTLLNSMKETNSTVDIGFHYSPCTPSATTACDSDGDGVSDVVEDTNGNGVADSNEFNWQVYDTDGDGISDGDEMAAYGYGQVVSWGSVGTATDAVANLPALTSYLAVSAGNSHNLALREGGSAYSWGSNSAGQTNVPPSATNLVAVAAGELHSLALDERGVIFAWGDNSSGQTNLPSSNTNFTAIAAGARHNLALKTDGTVIAWGNNAFGQTNVPVNATNVAYIAAGTNHSVALRKDGTLVAWGDNAAGQTNVSGLSSVAAVAAGTRHTAVLLTNGMVTIVGDCTTAPSSATNVLQIAAGHRFTVALKNDYTLVAWGDNALGQTNVPSGLTNVQSIACGPNRTVALPYTPAFSYPVDVKRDLLVIYNSNFTDGVTMKDYYLTHRPRLAGVNVLGVSLDNTLQETLTTTKYPSIFYPAVTAWYTANPTKRPAYLALMYGVPNRIAQAVTLGGSLQNDLRASLGTQFGGRRPYVSALNFYRTNDCTHYIDKLENIGTNNALNRVVLSADKAGVTRNVYVVDDVGLGDATVGPAKQALLKIGVPSGNILFRSNNGASDPPVTSATNILNFLSWGGYNGLLGWDWATNGSVKLYGNSSWYAAEAIESLNGQWPGASFQHSYMDWFSQYALGGTNWDKTPVAATSTTDEPTTDGMAQPKTWLTLWAIGKPAPVGIWLSQSQKPPNTFTHFNPRFIQITGDPLVRK